MEKGMQESNIEGIANHDVPESCADAREGGGEALTGVRTGEVLSREIRHFRAPTLLTEAEGNTPVVVMRETASGPARSKTPCTYGSLHAREPGDPRAARDDGVAGRVGKA
jgi:hypothetical protein